MENCVYALNLLHGGALKRIERTVVSTALHGFDTLAGTAGFMELTEEALESLLEANPLISQSEETILETIVHWIDQHNCGATTAASLLSRVRFPLMPTSYLKTMAMSRSTGAFACLGDMAREAIAIKASTRKQLATVRLRHLHASALSARSVKAGPWRTLELDTEWGCP